MSLRNGARPAVVFDCDGLLLDTERLWARGEERLFGRYGLPYTERHQREILGKNGAGLGRVLARLLEMPGRDTELVDELMEFSLREVREGEVRPMPGAVELVRDLRGRVPIGVATNAPREIARHSLRKAGLEDAFDVVLGFDDVSEPKPDPELYLSVCRRLGADPARSVGLEDSPAGSAAASAAGLYVIGVPSHPGAELVADRIVDSLAHPAVREALGRRVGVELEPS